MGLFDSFRHEVNLTPEVIFALSKLYMIGSDGEISEEEEEEFIESIQQFDNPENVVNDAINYWKNSHLDEFLERSKTILSRKQKLAVLVSMCHSLLADGDVDPSEQTLFDKFLAAFNISEEEFQPYIDSIIWTFKFPKDQ